MSIRQYTVVVREGIALKGGGSIQVCLHDVNVSIHSPSIKEANVEYDKETGKSNYSIMSGLPINFEEDELREFLYNHRKNHQCNGKRLSTTNK